jgi:hypothetical protein
MRWIDPATKTMEMEGAVLCWDNISVDTLRRDQKVYQLLLVGYDRDTDRIAIADSQGKNKDYYVFCPKIISSVEPIHLHYDFKELRRRLFVIPHKKWEKFNLEEKQAYVDMDIINDRINIDSVAWAGIEDRYYEFWNDEQNCLQYVGWRNILTRRGKKNFKIPESITSARWTITIDIIAVGLVLGAWSSIQDALEYFDAYWSYCNKYIYSEFGATLEHLKDFINEEVSVTKALNAQFIENGIKPQPVIIPAVKLKNKLAVLQAEGCLDVSPTNKDIQALMRELGYRLTKRGWMEK